MPKTSFARFAFVFSLCCLLSVALVSAHDNDAKAIGNTGVAGSGGSGPFEASGVNLLAHMELDEIGGGGSVLGSDCWGWTDTASDRKFALMCLTNALSFIEVTDPLNPIYLGKLDTAEAGQNQAWRDVKVYDDHAFIVADGGGNDQGIQVFDLSQLLTVDPEAAPVSFTETSHYTDFSSCHNIVVNEETGLGYAVGCRRSNGSRLYGGGLVILDFTNPTNITEVGSFGDDGYTHDAQSVVYDGPDSTYVGQEVVFACNEDTMTIVGISNGGANASLIAREPYAGSSYSHQGWLSSDHRFFYLNDELDEYNHARGPDGQFGTEDDGDPIPTRTHIWNVEDLDNPNYEGFYDGVEKTIDHNLYVKGDFMYQANYSSGMRVLRLDNADPTSISEVAFFDTYMLNNNVSFAGAWSVYPFFEFADQQVILISDRQGGLFVVEQLPEPAVTNIELNVEDDQRATVETVSISFDGDVTLDSGAVSVVQRSTATAATFDPVAITVNTELVGDQTIATIQFDSHVRNSANALVDGNYQFTLNGALISRDGVSMSQNFVYGDEEADGFYSFFGDSDGNRTVNVVDLLDFRQCFGAFSGDPNYHFYMDYDGNGSVNVFDLLPFRKNYFQTLPFTFGSARSTLGSGRSLDKASSKTESVGRSRR
jgi:choice-of-anchor B domain-containing protein